MYYEYDMICFYRFVNIKNIWHDKEVYISRYIYSNASIKTIWNYLITCSRSNLCLNVTSQNDGERKFEVNCIYVYVAIFHRYKIELFKPYKMCVGIYIYVVIFGKVKSRNTSIMAQKINSPFDMNVHSSNIVKIMKTFFMCHTYIIE